mmetsp:Transcript_17400/g.24163  ORF Transcript_17400/g.24163 Transcript_17400/m.24163 type:complete len:220 (-) Transcript_17400:106-765(-)
MICGGASDSGLDLDGRLTRTTHMYFLSPFEWYGNYYDMGGRFGHHASFQSDGNYVVYSENNEALWSTRTNVDYPKDKMEHNCGSHASCYLEFHGNDGEMKEWYSQQFYCRGRTLQPGERLDPTELICSEQNGHRFGFDEMGDLGLWLRGRKMFPAGTSGSYGNHLVMQEDGKLVLLNYQNNIRWGANTQNNPGAHVTIDDAGIVSVITTAGTTISSVYA